MIVKMLAFPAILLLVLYFAIVHIVPTAKNISKANQAIVEREKSLLTAKEQLGKVKAFQQEIDEHSTEVEYISEFVPNDQREEILLSDIAQLAEESGVNLFSVGFSEGRANTASGATSKSRLIEGKMIASGTYDNFKKFAHKLFRIKRLYGFKTFDLSKVEQKKQKEDEGEETQNSELLLNGTISFTYEYIPGKVQVSSGDIGQSIDFNLIDTIMSSTAQTNELVSEPNNRKNPFLP